MHDVMDAYRRHPPYGTFLRRRYWVMPNVLQLDRVSRQMFWPGPVSAGAVLVMVSLLSGQSVDFYSTICETYGLSR